VLSHTVSHRPPREALSDLHRYHSESMASTSQLTRSSHHRITEHPSHVTANVHRSTPVSDKLHSAAG
jgi:hypothetical protein